MTRASGMSTMSSSCLRTRYRSRSSGPRKTSRLTENRMVEARRNRPECRKIGTGGDYSRPRISMRAGRTTLAAEPAVQKNEAGPLSERPGHLSLVVVLGSDSQPRCDSRKRLKSPRPIGELFCTGVGSRGLWPSTGTLPGPVFVHRNRVRDVGRHSQIVGLTSESRSGGGSFRSRRCFHFDWRRFAITIAAARFAAAVATVPTTTEPPMATAIAAGIFATTTRLGAATTWLLGRRATGRLFRCRALQLGSHDASQQLLPRCRRIRLPQASAWLSSTTSVQIKAAIPTAARVTSFLFIVILQK